MINPGAKNQRSSWAKFLVAGTLIYIFIQAYSVISEILISFFLIMLITLAVNPIVRRMRHMMGGRTVATVLVVISFLGVIVLTGYGFYKPIQRSFSQVMQHAPKYLERLQKPLVRWEQQANISEQKLKKEVNQEMQNEHPTDPNVIDQQERDAVSPLPKNESVLKNSFSGWFSKVSGSFLKVASNAASLILIAVTVFVGVTYTLLTPKPVFATLYSFIPSKYHPKAYIIMRRIADFVPAWAAATLLGMVIVGLLAFLVMWVVLGFQDALVLGLIAMVMEAVPYVGPFLSVIPALLLGVSAGGWAPMWVLVAYAGIHLVESNIIYPLIVGKRLEMHPVAVIFSILFCVAAFGVLGVILAVPLVEVIRILHQELYRPKFLPDVSADDLNRLALKTLGKDP